ELRDAGHVAVLQDLQVVTRAPGRRRRPPERARVGVAERLARPLLGLSLRADAVVVPRDRVRGGVVALAVEVVVFGPGMALGDRPALGAEDVRVDARERERVVLVALRIAAPRIVGPELAQPLLEPVLPFLGVHQGTAE